MFQVIKLCGNFEPWWFLEDWQNDIVSSHLFFDFDQALTTYRELWNDMMRTYPYHKSKKNLLATFWDEDDQIWCEECDEDLKQYNSIMLLKYWEIVPEHYFQRDLGQINKEPEYNTSCKIS